MSLPRYLSIKRNNLFKLDSYDYQVLFMLYKPLIGPKAIDLFVTLYSISMDLPDTETDTLFLKDAISDYNLSDEELENNFAYLKTVKLIEYKLIKEENKWDIHLYPPYSGPEFFTLYNLAFAKQLKYRTSKFQFKSLMMKFMGKEIEVPAFNDEYEMKLSSTAKLIKPNKRKNDSVPFSFDEFKNELKDFAQIDAMDRLFFESAADLYGYTLLEMMNLFYLIENNGTYDKEKFLEEAYKKHKDSIPDIKKTDDEVSKSHIRYFEVTRVEEILTNVNVKSLSVSDRNTIKRMREELGLEEGLISLLIAYSISTNENRISAFKYYETIANDWKEKRINTVEDAYYYICTLYSKEFKSKKPLSNEDWVNNYWENYDKNAVSKNESYVNNYWDNVSDNKSKNESYIDNLWKENKK